MALILEVGTNTYVTLAEAETYMEGRLNSSKWDDATTANKEKALVSACREIEEQTYNHYRAVLTQTLSFPLIYQSSVPQQVKDCQSEWALELLEESYTLQREIDNGVTLIAIDGAQKSWGGNRKASVYSAKQRKALRFLLPYLAPNTGKIL